MLNTSLRALIEFHKTGTDTNRRSDIEGVRIPTLIIQGDHDQSIPVELSGRVCADLIDGSTLTVYENAPHGLYLTHRDQVSSAARQTQNEPARPCFRDHGRRISHLGASKAVAGGGPAYRPAFFQRK
jgi:hypothetical protein